MPKLIPTERKVPQAASVIDTICQSSAKWPQKDLFRYRRGGKDRAIKFIEFKQLVYAISAGLHSLSLDRAHIALIGEKSPEWVAIYYAVVNAGGVIVPLDKDLNPEQIPGFIEFADCEAVFYTEKYAQAIESGDSRLSGIKTFIKIDMSTPAEELLGTGDPSASDKQLLLQDVSAKGRSEISHGVVTSNEFDPDALSAILFTSGTTGTSKGVMLSQKSLMFTMNQSIKFVDLSENDVVLSVLPLHHTYEMCAGIFAPILLGGTICINDNLTSILSDFRHYRPTIMALVPVIVSMMYKRIIETARKQGKEKKLLVGKAISGGLMHIGIDVRRKIFSDILEAFGGRLSKIVCGGAALSAELVDNMQAFGISVQQGYGITECAPVIAIISYDVYNPTSCGRLLPGVQCYIDKEKPDDTTGEICVKGDNVMLGYYKNESATDDVLSKRGWFCTGDCGYADENGYLYITGRKKNVIVLPNGKNIFPEELEEYLEKIELVKDCMVTSREGEVPGSVQLTAIIYPDYDKAAQAGLDSTAAIKDYFRDAVKKINRKNAQFKQIKNIEIRKNPFPMTTTHKIQRYKVTKEE